MRTFSAASRVLGLAAAATVAVLVTGGAFLAGYLGEVQRGLAEPASPRNAALRQIETIEKSLGYGGFLKLYRSYRLTGDGNAVETLAAQAASAGTAIQNLKVHYRSNPEAASALREAASIAGTFVHVASIAPDASLRGTSASGELSALPQSPQLEAAYLSLRGVLDRLAGAERDRQFGNAAFALSWTQYLVVLAVALFAAVLLGAAALLQLGVAAPLKSLARSLSAAGRGSAGPVWGAARPDEIGEVARAGDELRMGLAEMPALESLARTGHVHVELDRRSSVLFEMLAADVRTAAGALHSACEDIGRLKEENRLRLEEAASAIAHSGAGFEHAARAVQNDAAGAIAGLRSTNREMTEAASSRLERLDALILRVGEAASRATSAAEAATGESTSAIHLLAGATATMKRAAEGVEQIQGAFFSTCDRISSGAANATGRLSDLSGQLGETAAALDGELRQKLASVTALDQALAAAAARIEAAEIAGRRLDHTAEDFEHILHLFREERGLQPAPPPPVEFPPQFAEALARLEASVERLASAPPPAVQAPATQPDLSELLATELSSVRAAIQDLGVRLTEDRILTSSSAPLPEVESETPHKTLADVPQSEILARLRDLAAEMSAVEVTVDETASLKAALSRFAREAGKLAAGADRAARMRALGKAMDGHASAIEEHAAVLAPSASALRGEVQNITAGLRSLAMRAQAPVVKDGPALRESAVELASRAESLYHYLRQTHPEPALDDDPDNAAGGYNSFDAAGADLRTLGGLVARLEERAVHMAETAVAARFGSGAVPNEHPGQSDDAIRTVFESIERLNNVAAALARAGDAGRQSRAAH